MTENNNKKKILIVDDNGDLRKTYAELFRKNGLNVVEAKDGVEGLDLATSEEGIDIIFTGIIMPRMDGFQMIEALQKQTSTAKIPFFINSHLGKEKDRIKAEEMGTEGFIVSGLITPAEAVNKIIRQLVEKDYTLKIDPYELDGQKLAEDLKLPEDLLCDNCGTSLALNISPSKEGYNASVLCPNCKKKF